LTHTVHTDMYLLCTASETITTPFCGWY